MHSNNFHAMYFITGPILRFITGPTFLTLTLIITPPNPCVDLKFQCPLIRVGANLIEIVL